MEEGGGVGCGRKPKITARLFPILYGLLSGNWTNISGTESPQITQALPCMFCAHAHSDLVLISAKVHTQRWGWRG